MSYGGLCHWFLKQHPTLSAAQVQWLYRYFSLDIVKCGLDMCFDFCLWEVLVIAWFTNQCVLGYIVVLWLSCCCFICVYFWSDFITMKPIFLKAYSNFLSSMVCINLYFCVLYMSILCNFRKSYDDNMFFLLMFSVTCILRWAAYKKEPTCPQCKHPFEFVYIHRTLDGR